MSGRSHLWNRYDVCDTCGCHRIWRYREGYWKFVWEDGRSVEPGGKGAPRCDGFSRAIVETCTTALMGAESASPREKVVAVLGAYQDVAFTAAAERGRRSQS